MKANHGDQPVNNETYAALQAMPKIELHRHLEGSPRLSTLLEIAQKENLPLPITTFKDLRPMVQVMPEDPRTIANFLSKFSVLRQFFTSLDTAYRLAQEAVLDAAEDNIKYMELRFTPRAWSNGGEIPAHDVVACVCDAVSSTTAEHDIEVKLIVSPNRHESVEIAQEATEAAIAHRNQGIVGVDLGGKEPGYQVYPFRKVFRMAKDSGLRITLHAGEWAGPESIWDAISTVGTERIGHGVQVMQDPGVVNILIDKGIVLEVCPSSNIETGSLPSFDSHPLPDLIDSGLKVTINTDDPLIFNVTLTDELYRSMQHFSLTLDAIKKQTILAAQAAFLPVAGRSALEEQFRSWLYPKNV